MKNEKACVPLESTRVLQATGVANISNGFNARVFTATVVSRLTQHVYLETSMSDKRGICPDRTQSRRNVHGMLRVGISQTGSHNRLVGSRVQSQVGGVRLM